jgi:glutamyl-tRNA reductase
LREIEALRLLSISQRTTALSDLAHLALPASRQAALREELQRLGVEAVVLGTCNRTELYWRSRGPASDEAVHAALDAAVSASGAVAGGAFTEAHGAAVATHAFRVASGLESFVLGETEVLGQVRAAVATAEAERAAGPSLVGLFRAALRCGGRVRSETRIGVGALSVASAAVQWLCASRGACEGLTVVVLGAGTTGLKAARHLRAIGVGNLAIVNRTFDRAERAAQDLFAIAVPLDALAEWLGRADVVLAAAQVEGAIVTPELLSRARDGATRPLVLVDLSLPRAIDPRCAALPGVEVRDLSALEDIVQGNRAGREREIPRAEALVARELSAYERYVGSSARRARRENAWAADERSVDAS